jgi:hypothetical protein
MRDECEQLPRASKKLPLLVERELRRLPEFGSMPIEARRRAWLDASRDAKSQTTLFYIVATTLAAAVLLVLLQWLPSDTGLAAEALSWASLLAILLLVLGVLHFVDVRRIRKRLWSRLAHLCSACGYDLTGTTSGVCPECGRAIEQKSSKNVQ